MCVEVRLKVNRMVRASVERQWNQFQAPRDLFSIRNDSDFLSGDRMTKTEMSNENCNEG